MNYEVARKDFSDIVRYYEDIIFCMPCNVYVFDSNCVGVCCNQNVVALCRLSSVEAFKGLDFNELGRLGRWTEEATWKFKQDTLNVLETGTAMLGIEEPPIPSPDGKMLYFLSSRVPLFDHARRVVGVVGISIDITERKNSEAELLIANQLAQEAIVVKTQFIQNMQHDIRTPTSGIWSVLACMAEQETDAIKREKLILLRDSAKQLLNICNTVIDFNKIEQGALPVNMVKMNLHQLVSSVIELNKAATFNKDLSLSLDIDKSIPVIVRGDAFRVGRILVNLIGNAIKFTEHGGISLVVKLVSTQDDILRVKFEVHDTGIGIPQDKKDFIYEKFNRLTPSSHNIYKGSGLGLNIVKQFVEDLNGALDVHSDINQGAHFFVELPFHTVLSHEQEGSLGLSEDIFSTDGLIGEPSCVVDAESSDLIKPLSVLFVEDEALACIAGQSVLQKENCEAVWAGDVAQARVLLETRKFDLVISDIGLPDGSGIDIIQCVKSNKQSLNYSTVFFALTAHNDQEKLKEIKHAGFDEALSKPLMGESLRVLLNNYFTDSHKAYST